MKSRMVHIAGGRTGYALGKDYPAERKASEIQGWRQEIADLEGDVDACTSRFGVDQLQNPAFSANAAQRLVSAGRADTHQS